jgi:uncharacterized glyoxalase superfamily protein PhnB
MSDNLVEAAPVLSVDDAVETAEYYRDRLGFEIEFTWGNPPYYAIVKRGGVAIHFSEREDTSKKITPSMVYVFVEDVDEMYDELKQEGLEMFSPPENQDYGMREFELCDMNGHFLVFGCRA